MRIIDKRGRKDYYDFLSGIYGVDPLITLDRREYDVPMLYNEEKIILYIAGKRIEGFYKNGKFYYGEKLEELDGKPSIRHFNYRDNKEYYYVETKYSSYRTPVLKNIIDTDINEKYNHPILLHKPYSTKEDFKSYYRFPILKDLSVQSFLEPEKIWLMLVDFLTKKDVVEDHRTNNEKIVCAGFDLKESFRGKPVL